MLSRTHLGWVYSLTVCLGLSGCAEPANSTPAVTPAPALSTGTERPTSEGFTATPSGLKYKVLKQSTGTKPTATNTVTVNYRGWLDNGQEFDAGNGITFGLGQVIPGWTEGLQLIGEGGTIELEIPSQLAYGDQEIPGIPANSTLHFNVELISVK